MGSNSSPSVRQAGKAQTWPAVATATQQSSVMTRSSPEDEPVLLTVSPFQVTMGSRVDGAPTALPEARIAVAYKVTTGSCRISWAKQLS